MSQSDLPTTYQQDLDAFIQREDLPASYREDAQRWFLPLVTELVDARHERSGPLFVGINGAQGSGKSTLASLLAILFRGSGLNAVSLSIDDFYLSRAGRQRLAREVHPLLATRGVPGTHNTDLALETLAALRQAGGGDRIGLPAFDKAEDDCMPKTQWREVEGPLDLVILEGWFIGARPQAEVDLREPINALEAEEDPAGTWRSYVNQSLAGAYQGLFDQLDELIFLQTPGFEQVLEWRTLQEAKLRQRSGEGSALMTEKEIRRFIAHFERLTRHCLATLPGQADIVFSLDAHHRITGRR